jgi:hypothetical protein
MPGPTVVINAPLGNVPAPITARGFAMPNPSTATVVGLGYQVNAGPIIHVSATQLPNWTIQLTNSDAPQVGVTYLLTVYAGDNTGAFATASCNFTRTS